jgi:hypothetical protein
MLQAFHRSSLAAVLITSAHGEQTQTLRSCKWYTINTLTSLLGKQERSAIHLEMLQ